MNMPQYVLQQMPGLPGQQVLIPQQPLFQVMSGMSSLPQSTAKSRVGQVPIGVVSKIFYISLDRGERDHPY